MNTGGGAPRLEINLSKIHHNARFLVDRLAVLGISVTGMTKAVLGSPFIAKTMLNAGVSSLGDSRLSNIKEMHKTDAGAQFILTRSPMLSQVDDVVTYADISFNTEIDTIVALSAAAKNVGKKHGIVLMVELGDLREGIMPDDVEDIVRKVLRLPNIKFMGLGANLACRNGVMPDTNNMQVLSELADSIDSITGSTMEIVSGGNSSNLEWALNGAEVGRINNLRIGEAILLGVDPLNRKPVDGLNCDAFTLVAEIIEAKIKPSQPWGDIGQSAFDNVTAITGQNNIFQILLALGEQDIDPNGLSSSLDINILGSSSDHLILDGRKCDLSIGEELSFCVNYSALVRSMTSPFVVKIMQK